MIIELERQRSPVVVIAHQVVNLVQPHFMPFHLLILFMEGPLFSMHPLFYFIGNLVSLGLYIFLTNSLLIKLLICVVFGDLTLSSQL